jgi:very-short-patch-repair endonuclease
MIAHDETRDFAKFLRRRLTLPEGLLWRSLKGRKADGLHFRKQHPIGPYILDFYCAQLKLCVEVDGQAHGFGEIPAKDQRRDAWLAAHEIRTLRIPAYVVLEDLDAAVGWVIAVARGEQD